MANFNDFPRWIVATHFFSIVFMLFMGRSEGGTAGSSGPPRTSPQVVDTLAGQNPDRLDGSVSWASPGPVPVWLDQLREVSEQFIHR